MDLLNLSKVYKDILWRDYVGEGLISTIVVERDREFVDTAISAMILRGGQTGNIE